MGKKILLVFFKMRYLRIIPSLLLSQNKLVKGVKFSNHKVAGSPATTITSLESQGADEIILIDEVLTPDSSRYWPRSEYKPGVSPPSFDKQIVRDYLAETWNKKPPIPTLPNSIIDKASQKYQEVFELLNN